MLRGSLLPCCTRISKTFARRTFHPQKPLTRRAQMTSAPAPPQERPLIVGRDEGPEDPFPLRMEGNVTTGFQRGSSLVCFSPS